MANVQQAASIALVRGEGAEREVLLVRRAPGTLMEGSWGFPGGLVEEDDATLSPRLWGGGRDRAERSAAIRELFEETGLAPVTGSLPPLPPGASLPEALQLCAARVDLDAVHPAGRFGIAGLLVPPVQIALYVAELPPGGVSTPRLGDEIAEAEWAPPRAWISRWERAEIVLPPSVREPLMVLAGGGGPTDLAALPGDPPPAYELLRGVTVVPVKTPTLPPATHTNCYVLGTGETRIVVDPASPYPEAQAVLDGYLDGLAEDGVHVREIWATHHHPDHVGGIAHLKSRRGLSCRAHAATAERTLEGLVDSVIAEDEVLALPGPIPQRWRALYTPGHTRDHFCFHEEHTGAVIVGDLMAGVGTVVVDPPEGNMRQYFASLRRVRALDPNVVFPAHGPPSAFPLARIDVYLAHRQMREDAILAALDAGAATPAEIVSRVYTDVPAALHPLAERNVRAHLEKLEEEGRIELG